MQAAASARHASDSSLPSVTSSPSEKRARLRGSCDIESMRATTRTPPPRISIASAHASTLGSSRSVASSRRSEGSGSPAPLRSWWAMSSAAFSTEIPSAPSSWSSAGCRFGGSRMRSVAATKAMARRTAPSGS